MISIANVIIAVVGIVIGLLLGLTGGGGSILTVPLLVYVVGLEAKIAIATSLLVVGLASLAAIVPHSRSGNVYWRIGAIFGVAGMVGAYAGGRIAQFIADGLLLLLFAAVMIGSGIAMLRKGRPSGSTNESSASPQSRSLPKILGDGFVVGIVTGLVGAGGGFLVVPALVLLGGLPMHAAVGTSLLVIAMKCLAGLAGYISHVPVDANSAAIVGSLAVVGTLAGSHLSRKIPGQALQRGFGRFVLVIAAILIVIEGSGLLAPLLDVSRMTIAAVLGASSCAVIATAYLVSRKSSGASALARE